MRQNGTTISLLLDCVSYEILCETRIKPSFFGNCLIFLSSALGAQCLGSQFAGVAPQASRGAWPRGTIRAKGRWLNAASVRTTSARARRRRVKVSSTFSKVAGGAGAQWAPFSARSPLPRRSVLDVCHWQTAPEPAGESVMPEAGRRGPTPSCPRAGDRKSDKLSKNPGNMRAPQFVP